MSEYDRRSWEERWAGALRTHGDRLAQRPPNAHVVAALAELQPGRALDAGCGHGAESLWLAGRGWRVTGVDFSTTALAHARSTAATLGVEVEWLESDLSTWSPPEAAYELVLCVFVHSQEPVALARRMAAAVVPGGTLLLVGNQPVEPGQTQVSVADARAALDPGAWQVVAADEHRRPDGSVDAVVGAQRRSGST